MFIAPPIKKKSIHPNILFQNYVYTYFYKLEPCFKSSGSYTKYNFNHQKVKIFKIEYKNILKSLINSISKTLFTTGQLQLKNSQMYFMFLELSILYVHILIGTT